MAEYSACIHGKDGAFGPVRCDTCASEAHRELRAAAERLKRFEAGDYTVYESDIGLHADRAGLAQWAVQRLTAPQPGDLEAELQAVLDCYDDGNGDLRGSRSRMESELLPLLHRAAGGRADDPGEKLLTASHDACMHLQYLADRQEPPTMRTTQELADRLSGALREINLGRSDDGEPVTKEWFPKRIECGDNSVRVLWSDAHARGIALILVSHSGQVVRICDNPTRGDVRRLCAALGVPLTEAT